LGRRGKNCLPAFHNSVKGETNFRKEKNMYPQNNSYYYQQSPVQSYYNPPHLKGRPVSSFEEARAITIDFDGSTFFFPDTANKRIYTKQINMDGTSSLLVYELRESPLEQNSNQANFITREEFERAISEMRALLPNAAPQPTSSQPVGATAAKLETSLSKLF
jgi:hypothetical protein